MVYQRLKNTMSNKDKILNYLRYIAPDRATNADLRQQTGIRSHQQVYMLTQELMLEHQISGVQHGKEWFFWCDTNPTVHPEWQAARERHDPSMRATPRRRPSSRRWPGVC